MRKIHAKVDDVKPREKIDVAHRLKLKIDAVHHEEEYGYT